MAETEYDKNHAGVTRFTKSKTTYLVCVYFASLISMPYKNCGSMSHSHLAIYNINNRDHGYSNLFLKIKVSHLLWVGVKRKDWKPLMRKNYVTIQYRLKFQRLEKKSSFQTKTATQIIPNVETPWHSQSSYTRMHWYEQLLMYLI